MSDHALPSPSTAKTTGAQAIPDTPARRPRRLFGRQLPTGEEGMTTAEYAVGTIAACGFAGVLWAVVHSPTVAHLLSGVVERALQTSL